MFLLLLLLLVAVVAAAHPFPRRAEAVWHTIEWDAAEFTAFSGDFVVPNVPKGAKGGIPFVWPGLQGDSGVLQAVLDGQSGSWSLGNGFFGDALRPLGDRFDVQPGDSVHFSFSRQSPTGPWTCTLSGPRSTSATISVPGSAMTRAVLAVDLTDVPHDFTVVYNNVVITAANVPAKDWCGKTGSRGYDNSDYTITNATADGKTCHISTIVLPNTA